MTVNKPYFIRLNKIPFIGPRTIAKLYARWPNLAELFRLSVSQLEQAGLPNRLAKLIPNAMNEEVETDLLWQEKENHAILTWEDAHYPSLLKEIPDPPPVLYTLGNLACLQAPTLAIVGTRNPSVLGVETAWQFAKDLAALNLTIVSGLALGIDAKAHRGALAAEGKTIAVLGSGLDHIYPSVHRDLALQIADNGLLISEFSLETRPKAGHFPRRNRIISGLSLATLVVEAAIKSGSLITARMALEQNRDVFAIPGSILNPQAKGCHLLLQEGATLVTSVLDIMNELNLFYEQTQLPKTVPSLAMDEQNLVKCIGFEVTTVDQMITRSRLSIAEVVCLLATLELKGVVKAVPGGYIRCVQ